MTDESKIRSEVKTKSGEHMTSELMDRTIAKQVQHEMNQKRLVQFIKSNDLNPTGNDTPTMTGAKATIWGQFTDISIWHIWDTDIYLIKEKHTGRELDEDEISVWLTQQANTRPEHIKSSSKIKSIDFNNPNNLNGKMIIDTQTLWEVSPALRARMMNLATQEWEELFASRNTAGGASDEEIIEKIAYIYAKYDSLRTLLHNNRIKVLDQVRKSQQEEYLASREKKATKTAKAGSKTQSAKTKTPKVAIAGNADGKNIKADPLYAQYKHDEQVITFFGKIKRQPLASRETWEEYKKFQEMMS